VRAVQLRAVLFKIQEFVTWTKGWSVSPFN
jgi:hypothetical protein